MMSCWNPADTEDAPEPDVQPWAWQSALTVIVALSAGGWSLIWFVIQMLAGPA